MPSDTEFETHLRAFNALYGIYNNVATALQSIPEPFRDAVRKRWEETRPATVTPGVLSAEEGPDWWRDIEPGSLHNWKRLMDLLLQKGWHETAVRNLDLESNAVVRELADPRAPPVGQAAFRTQGLVVGYVQSGKTANFTAVTAKAVDAGYRLVIVLAGIHNSLRRQTQQRLEKELCQSVPGTPGWLTLTKPDNDGDFRMGTFSAQVLHGNQPMLAVVKKNGAVLKRLLDWLPVADALSSIPVLIIDDEADQASVNTGSNQAEVTDPEEEYSRINGRIRELMLRFKRVSYVAYTATPFANVFIDHEGIDYRVQQDLYPKDFIIALDKPSTYVGASDLFGFPDPGSDVERQAMDIVVRVPDQDIAHVVPPSTSKAAPGTAKAPSDIFPPALPDSLNAAIRDFIIAAGAFLHRRRSKGDQPVGMLIHTSSRTEVQKRIGELVDAELASLRRQFLYDRKAFLPTLENRWREHFLPVTRGLRPSDVVPFEEIVPYMERLFQKGLGRHELVVLTVNSASDDVLDYEKVPNLKAIVVGGNKLSRGLTIEGLLSSYFVRESPMFDTLLQMGRWFGHRRDYVDLTRLHTTYDLIDWFQFLALAEDELREDIRLYGETGRKPTDFAPRVRCHPILKPTAANKMKAASTVGTSYAGSLKQTILFSLDRPEALKGNLEAAKRLVAGLGKPDGDDDDYKWTGVPVSAVLAFLRAYRAGQEGERRAAAVDPERLAAYIEAQVRYGELVEWDIRVVSRRATGKDVVRSLPVDLERVPPIERSRLAGSNSIGILVNPVNVKSKSGDELLGLSPAQVEAARTAALANPKLGFGRALRNQRDPRRGALLLYPISRDSKPDASEDQSSRQRREPLYLGTPPKNVPATIVGFAISFPDSRSVAADDEHWVGTAGAYGEK